MDLSTESILRGGPQALAALQNQLVGRSSDAMKAQKAARDFEAILVGRMLEEMRRTIPKSGLLASPASDQMEGLFWFYLAQEVADRGGIGLYKDLCRQFTESAGLAPGASAAPAVEAEA